MFGSDNMHLTLRRLVCDELRYADRSNRSNVSLTGMYELLLTEENCLGTGSWSLKISPSLPHSFLRLNWGRYSQFVEENVTSTEYVECMLREGVWGDHIEMDAACRLFGVCLQIVCVKRGVVTHQYMLDPLHGGELFPRLGLLYSDDSHYDALQPTGEGREVSVATHKIFCTLANYNPRYFKPLTAHLTHGRPIQ